LFIHHDLQTGGEPERDRTWFYLLNIIIYNKGQTLMSLSEARRVREVFRV
jgi:hypothetical protein